jgi:putative copper resistance protein D
MLILGPVAIVGLVLLFAGLRRRRSHASIAGAVALVLSLTVAVRTLAVPAFPTTYASAPVPYDTRAVARGARLFAQYCSACHGAEGRGDGASAATLAVKPANLDEHALHHPPGNLFWWIAHGIRDTPMPAFSGALPDRAIWELVQYVVARASADEIEHVMGVSGGAGARVPEFTYEIPGQGQRSLLSAGVPTLLVLYGPESEPRLDRLVADRRLPHTVRVVAMPLSGATPAASPSPALHPILDSSVASVYAMFAGHARPGSLHTELLVDATGRVKGRWTGVSAPGVDRDAEIVRAAAQVRSASAKSAMMHHGH